jgi:dihydrofolate reductase
MVQATGAYIVGKHTFTGANENPVFQKSTFVVTHTGRAPLDKQGATITFVTEGIENALKQAQAAAGDKDVCIFGGASVAQQYLHANLVDEIDINLIPKLIGGGLRLFDEEWGQPVWMEIQNVVAGAQVTHMKYRVIK